MKKLEQKSQMVRLMPSMGLPYFALLQRGLEEAGWRVVTSSAFPRRIALGALERPEVFHIHMLDHVFMGPYGKKRQARLFYFRFFLLPLMRLLGIKLIWTCHELSAHEQDPYGVTDNCAALMCRKADAVVVHNRAMLQTLIKRHPQIASKVHLLPHGDLRPYYMPYIRHEDVQSKHDGRLRLCSVGYMRRNKGNDTILRAFRKLPLKDVKLIMIGNCREPVFRGELTRLAEGDPRIELVFKDLSNQEIVDVHQTSDAAVFAFRDCPTTGSVITSMSLGCPPIVPAIGHAAELVDEQVGWVYDARDGELGLLDALHTAVMQKQSCGARGVAARMRIAQEEWTEIIGQLIQIYEGKRPRPS